MGSLTCGSGYVRFRYGIIFENDLNTHSNSIR